MQSSALQTGKKVHIVAIVGPTASGKTALAVALAQKYNAEILSFDSMQLYVGMDIATAKPTDEEKAGIVHHMISAIPNDKPFSVADYKEKADAIIAEIVARGKNVIMVGGTGLYLDTVVNNIELLPSSNNPEVRERLQKELLAYGPEYMHSELAKIDKASAEQIHANNTSRVIRALEVYYTTGHTMSYQVEQSKKNGSNYETLYIGLDAKDRDYLYNRINKRVDVMLEQGLLKEVEDFVSSPPGATAKQAIGLKELAPFVKGEKDLETCLESLKQETRHYAKRQLTWFRKNENVNWLFIDEVKDKEELLNQSIDLIEKSKIFKEG